MGPPLGATGDLAKRKLLPGLLHLKRSGLLPECQIVGTSLDDIGSDEFGAARAWRLPFERKWRGRIDPPGVWLGQNPEVKSVQDPERKNRVTDKGGMYSVI